MKFNSRFQRFSYLLMMSFIVTDIFNLNTNNHPRATDNYGILPIQIHLFLCFMKTSCLFHYYFNGQFIFLSLFYKKLLRKK